MASQCMMAYVISPEIVVSQTKKDSGYSNYRKAAGVWPGQRDSEDLSSPVN